MNLCRLVFIAAVAGLALIPGASAAHAPAPATLTLSSAGKKALKQRSVTLKSVPSGLKLPVGTATFGSSATVQLRGTLRFSSGKRKVSATRLTVTIGRTSSYVSARLGKVNVRLLTVTPTRPAVLDSPGQQVSVTRARIAFTPAAAKRLKTALRLKRAPSTAALGTLSLTVAPHDHTPTEALPAPAPAPTPAPVVVTPTPTPTPAPTATPTPEPPPPCQPLFDKTPAGSVDWFGCDLPDGGNLKSWTNYVLSPFPPITGCQGMPGSIVASAGAARIHARSPYDHRLTVESVTEEPDGRTIVALSGTVTYLMPAHGIDEAFSPKTIEIAADGTTGTLFADGRAKRRDLSPDVCTTPSQPYTGAPVLTLDFTGVAPAIDGGVQRWGHVPAKLTAIGNELIGGEYYGAGSRWGGFTIAVAE